MTTRTRHILFWSAVVLIAFFLLYELSDILLPFVAGMAVAFLLDPVADRLERWGLPRWVASLILVVLFFGIALLLLLAFVPTLIEQVGRFVEALPNLIERARRRLLPILLDLQAELGGGSGDGRQAVAGAENAVNWAANLLRGVLGSGLAFFNLLSLLLITPVVAFFMLRDWDAMVARIDSWLPRRNIETIRDLAREADEVLSGFVRGQAFVCLVQGTFYAVGLSLAGLDYALLIGFGSGALAFVPYVGAFVGLAASMLVAFFQEGSTYPWMALVLAIYGLGQFLEGNFVTPKLVGDRVRLHPVWVIFALLAFGAIFGFVGVLLAVPIAAVIGVLVRFTLTRYLQSPLYQGGHVPPAEP